YRSYAMRARLDNAQGGHSNHAIWTGPAPLVGFEGANGSLTANGFLEMDQWLTAVYNDPSSATIAQKIVTDKPAAATDTCFAATGPGVPLPPSGCTAIYPYYGSPRVGAGEPLADDVLKC